MDLGIKGKTVLVTGASKGIGAATAKLFAEEGCDVLLVARSEADLQSVRDAIRGAFPVKAGIVATDLSSGDNVLALARAHPDVDILVNNAGAIPHGALLDIQEPVWREAWDLKVFGYINMCRAYYALMKQRGAGVIINVIGIGDRTRNPDYICGATGNAALAAFTQALGHGSVRDGIRVLGLSPGPVETERMVYMSRRRAEQNLGDAERWRELASAWPFKRAASTREIAAGIAFLCSPVSGYTSGTVLPIDGGISARGG